MIELTAKYALGKVWLDVVHFHMVKDRSRRSFLRSAPLAAAAAGLPLSSMPMFAEPAVPEPFQVFTAAKLAEAMKGVQARPGNDNLFQNAALPLTIVMTTEGKKAGKEL